MKNKSALQSVLIYLFVVLAFAVYSSTARAVTTSWTGALNDDWFNGSNWTMGAPDPSKDAVINNGGKAAINHAGAMALSLTLGTNVGESGTVSVAGMGSLVVTRDLSVGYRGRGTLSITNGATVTSQNGYIAELSGGGVVEDSNGTVTVDGASWTIGGSFTAQLFIGGSAGDAGGTALLSLTNGGTVMVRDTQGAQTPVTVGSSGTVTGSGFLSTMGSLNPLVVVKGTLAPIEGLKVLGDVYMTGSATITCNVTPGANDRVDVLSGQATLNGRLLVTMTGTFTPGTRYTLLTAAGGLVPNTAFSSVSIKFPTGQNFSPQITYDTNNVYLNLESNTAPGP